MSKTKQRVETERKLRNPITVNVTDETLAALEAVAARERRRIVDLLRIVLDDYLADNGMRSK
jgi:hypothetical protein